MHRVELLPQPEEDAGQPEVEEEEEEEEAETDDCQEGKLPAPAGERRAEEEADHEEDEQAARQEELVLSNVKTVPRQRTSPFQPEE